jgi:hypothetical protein
MGYQVRVDQIQSLWPSIKFAAAQANAGVVSEKNLPVFLNKLLASLMSGVTQCFVRVDENNQLLALAITQLNEDKVSGEKFLLFLYMYSFKPVDNQQWIDDFNEVKSFAKQNKCTRILLNSSNNRMFEIVSLLGFSEYYRCFTFSLE